MNLIDHLLTCLSEECAEVIQAATKAQRFGIHGKYPDGRVNVDVIAYELNDVLAVVQLLVSVGVDLPNFPISTAAIECKKVKVVEMMEMARERGCLEKVK